MVNIFSTGILGIPPLYTVTVWQVRKQGHSPSECRPSPLTVRARVISINVCEHRFSSLLTVCSKSGVGLVNLVVGNQAKEL